MLINYLKGATGDAINLMMSAAAFNFKSRINKIRQTLFFAFFQFVSSLQLFSAILFLKPVEDGC